jgi:hypothetical protein
MTEDELLRNVLHAAKLLRWRCYHVRNSRLGIIQGDVGFPDLVLVRAPRIIFVELKAAKGRVGPAQQEWLLELMRCPGAQVDVWHPEDWLTGRIESILL